MMSSKNEPVCICALSNLTSQIVFDAWRVSMNVVSKLPSAWNDSRHAPSWWLYLHCRIEETGSPGIVCIVCHQVLRHPSQHGTSWIGKHLPAKAHIGKLQKSTESEITELTRSTVDETALAIPRREGSRGLTMVSLQSKFILDVQVWSWLTKLTDKTLHSGSDGLWNFLISPKHMESHSHVRICFNSYSMEHNFISQATTVI